MKLTEGRWLVVTATSQYIVDIDEQWLIRKPGTGPLAGDGVHRVTSMISDGEKVGLDPRYDVEVEVGQSATFWTTVFVNAWRMTTAVQQLWFLDGDGESLPAMEAAGIETAIFEAIS